MRVYSIDKMATNVTVSAESLQRIYERISQIEKDARVVADEYCRLLRLRAAGDIPSFSSLTPLSQAAFRIADTSTQALVAMEIAMPFLLERDAQKHVAENCACCRDFVSLTTTRPTTVAVKPVVLPEEEDLYA
jgi:hypothetical protein